MYKEIQLKLCMLPTTWKKLMLSSRPINHGRKLDHNRDKMFFIKGF